MSAVHTAGPGSPSTPRPFWVSNASTAALVIMLEVPWVHCDVSASGIPGQRQAKVPAWSDARSALAGAGPAGVKASGRKLSWARSCCRRSVSPAATPKETVWVAASVAPDLSRTPPEPPGIVSTSWEDGMSGESRL